MISLDDIQRVTTPWRDSNFPYPLGDVGRSALEQLAGVTEELGELAHAVLKSDQSIRNNENLDAKGQDAVGDLIIYLCGLCDRKGWDLRTCVNKAWEEVKDRDWIKYPDTGRPPNPEFKGLEGLASSDKVLRPGGPELGGDAA